MKQPIRGSLLGACALSGLALQGFVSAVHAGGFALVEHGASGMGNAYAGAAAVAHDTSTIWFNPAGMSELSGRELGIGLHVIVTDTDWSDRGTSLNAAFDGAPVPGPDSSEVGTTTPIPNLFYSAPIDERWSYGLAISAPFGSSTDYDEGWKGRYGSLESRISVIDVNPAVSYRVSDTVRLGAGLSVQFASAELTSAVDSSAACFGTVGSVEPVACVQSGLADFGNPALDSRGEISGDSTAFSFNLGALFLPRPGTRIGLAYRHGAEHELEGDADFTTEDTLRGLLDGFGAADGAPGPLSSFLTDTGGDVELDLPATFMVSVAQTIGERVELLGDITWTGWSSIEEIRVEYDNPLQPDTLSLQDWEDVFRYSAGINFSLNERLTLRGGVAFDEEAIPSPARRTPRIPGNDRTWLAFGAGYDIGDNITIDVGYAHLFLPDTAIDNDAAESPGSTTIRGEYESGADILSAQFSWHFD